MALIYVSCYGKLEVVIASVGADADPNFLDNVSNRHVNHVTCMQVMPVMA